MIIIFAMGPVESNIKKNNTEEVLTLQIHKILLSNPNTTLRICFCDTPGSQCNKDCLQVSQLKETQENNALTNPKEVYNQEELNKLVQELQGDLAYVELLQKCYQPKITTITTNDQCTLASEESINRGKKLIPKALLDLIFTPYHSLLIKDPYDYHSLDLIEKIYKSFKNSIYKYQLHDIEINSMFASCIRDVLDQIVEYMIRARKKPRNNLHNILLKYVADVLLLLDQRLSFLLVLDIFMNSVRFLLMGYTDQLLTMEEKDCFYNYTKLSINNPGDYGLVLNEVRVLLQLTQALHMILTPVWKPVVGSNGLKYLGTSDMFKKTINLFRKFLLESSSKDVPKKKNHGIDDKNFMDFNITKECLIKICAINPMIRPQTTDHNCVVRHNFVEQLRKFLDNNNSISINQDLVEKVSAFVTKNNDFNQCLQNLKHSPKLNFTAQLLDHINELFDIYHQNFNYFMNNEYLIKKRQAYLAHKFQQSKNKDHLIRIAHNECDKTCQQKATKCHKVVGSRMDHILQFLTLAHTINWNIDCSDENILTLLEYSFKPEQPPVQDIQQKQHEKTKKTKSKNRNKV